MRQNGLRRITVVVMICALVGALAGIAGSAAAPSDSKTAEKAAAKKQKAAAKKARQQAKDERRALRMRGAPGLRMRGRGLRLHGGPVHSEAVVPNKDGDGFITVTMDHGTFKSLDGTTLHLKQGIDGATYKEDAAIDVGGDAKVFRNGDEAKLSDLKEGDRVHVVRSPEGNVVMAADANWMPRMHRGFGHPRGLHRGHHRGGPGGPGGPPMDMPGDQGGSNENGSGTQTVPGGTSS